MSRLLYKTLENPPLRLPISSIINLRKEDVVAGSTYVFDDSEAGKQKAKDLVSAIIKIEREKTRAFHNMRSDFDSPEYMGRVFGKLSRAFDAEGQFHMQRDLETYLGPTNLPESRFEREGGVVFFEMHYFSPCDQSIKVEIEQKLGLKKKIVKATQNITYSRVEGGFFFNIPFEQDLFKRFSWLSGDPYLGRDVSFSMRNGVYSLGLSTKDNGNVFTFSLGLRNVSDQWITQMRAVKGTLRGSAVSQEISLSQRTARADFEAFIKAERRQIEVELAGIAKGAEYVDPVAAAASLKSRLANLNSDNEELFATFELSRGEDLRRLQGRVAKADRLYGEGNKAVVSRNGTETHLYFSDPVLVQEISLKKVIDYHAAGAFLESYFL